MHLSSDNYCSCLVAEPTCLVIPYSSFPQIWFWCVSQQLCPSRSLYTAEPLRLFSSYCINKFWPLTSWPQILFLILAFSPPSSCSEMPVQRTKDLMYVFHSCCFPEVPEVPYGLRVLDKSGRSVQLSWAAPYDGNSPIKRYLIEYKISRGECPSCIQLSICSAEWKMFWRNFVKRDVQYSFPFNAFFSKIIRVVRPVFSSYVCAVWNHRLYCITLEMCPQAHGKRTLTVCWYRGSRQWLVCSTLGLPPHITCALLLRMKLERQNLQTLFQSLLQKRVSPLAQMCALYLVNIFGGTFMQWHLDLVFQDLVKCYRVNPLYNRIWLCTVVNLWRCFDTKRFCD
jgi:hypothetical protein